MTWIFYLRSLIHFFLYHISMFYQRGSEIYTIETYVPSLQSWTLISALSYRILHNLNLGKIMIWAIIDTSGEEEGHTEMEKDRHKRQKRKTGRIATDTWGKVSFMSLDLLLSFYYYYPYCCFHCCSCIWYCWSVLSHADGVLLPIRVSVHGATLKCLVSRLCDVYVVRHAGIQRRC